MMRRRRVARRTGRRAARGTMRRRRVFRPAPMMYRRPLIRRPLGTMLIVGAAAGVAYKLGKKPGPADPGVHWVSTGPAQ